MTDSSSLWGLERTPPGPLNLKIEKVSCAHVPEAWPRSDAKRYYFEVGVDQKVTETQKATICDSRLEFNDVSILEVNNVSLPLVFTLYRTIGVNSKIILGQFSEPIIDLLKQSPTTGASHIVKALTLWKNDTMEMDFTISFIDDTQAMTPIPILSEQQESRLERSPSRPLVKLAEKPMDWWTPIDKSLQIFFNLVIEVDEAHPFIKAIYTILFGARHVITPQLKHDEDVQNLLISLSKIYQLVEKLQDIQLEVHERSRNIILRISQQMVEVAYFARTYCQNRGLLERIASDLSADATSMLQDCTDRLEELVRELGGTRTIKPTEVKMICILKRFEKIDIDQWVKLGQLRSIPNRVFLVGPETTGFKSEKGILDYATSWILNPVSSEHGLLICHSNPEEVPIARIVAGILQPRLGSIFRFSKNDKARTVQVLLSHIARGLADLENAFAIELARVISSPEFARAKQQGLQAQFEQLILRPAKSMSGAISGPIVIIIDALDEAEDDRELEALLQIFATRMPDLPRNFRVLLVSRPEPRILNVFENSSNVLVQKSGAVNQHIITNSIISYVSAQFSDSNGVLSGGMDYPKCRRLAQISGGSIAWANYVCGWVYYQRNLGRLGQFHTPPMPATLGIENKVGLESFYNFVFEQYVGQWGRTTLYGLASRLVTEKPTSTELLVEFAAECVSSNPFSEFNASDMVKSFISMLQSVKGPAVPISFLPYAFEEYLAYLSKGTELFTDFQAPLDRVKSMLQFMSARLTFNTAKIESSYTPNQNVPNQTIKDRIPSHLSHVCHTWGDNLLEVTFPKEEDDEERKGLVTEVDQFLRTRFLFWLEVISLTGATGEASTQMRKVTSWLENNGARAEEIAFAYDARQFCSYFAKCIEKSAPHIYISALPFAPSQSLVAKEYAKYTKRVLSVEFGQLNHWPPALFEVEHGQTKTMTISVFSCDRSLMATGFEDGTIHVWDTADVKLVFDPLKGHTKSIKSLTFSPDGTKIASASEDQTVRIWDTKNGELVLEPLQEHEKAALCVAFSPDGSRIASGSADRKVRIWSTTDGSLMSGPLKGHNNWVWSVAFSPDGSRMASGCTDGIIRMWKSDGTPIGAPLRGHDNLIHALAFSPDGSRLVSGSKDKTIRIWNVADGSLSSGPFEGHTNRVHSVAFSADGTRIVSGSLDNTIRVWNTTNTTLKFRPIPAHFLSIYSVKFSSDDAHILYGSVKEKVAVSALIEGSTGPIGTESPSKSVSEPQGVFVDTKHQTEGLVLSPWHTKGIRSVVFSPDCTKIASASEDTTVRVWDAATGNLICGPLHGHTGWVKSVCFSPDGAQIATGSDDQTIRMWNVADGTLISKPFAGHTDWVNSIAFSPDGTQIASCSADKTVRVWDVRNGTSTISPFNGHTEDIRSVAFSPDGTRIASGSNDKTVRVWNANNGAPISTPFTGHTDGVKSVAFAPDGTRIVSGSADKTLRVWNAEDGTLVAGPFEGHTRGIWSVAFSPDGTRVASGSWDDSIRVWDAKDGALAFGPYKGHDDDVLSVAFSPDGSRIISGSSDKTIRVWEFEKPTKLAKLKKHFPKTDPIQIKDKDGWILGPDGELLLYVPRIHRTQLHVRTKSFTIGQWTKLDLTNFAYGDEWETCFEGDQIK